MKTQFESLLAGALILCGSGASTASAAPVSLVLPQSTAFAILGHSCGGIQEKAYVTGFDPTTGYPTGDVYLQTRCSTGGRGGGTITYTAWAGVTWDFAGNVVSSTTLATAPAVDPTFSATDAYGDMIYNLNNAAYLVVPAPTAPTDVHGRLKWATSSRFPGRRTGPTRPRSRRPPSRRRQSLSRLALRSSRRPSAGRPRPGSSGRSSRRRPTRLPS